MGEKSPSNVLTLLTEHTTHRDKCIDIGSYGSMEGVGRVESGTENKNNAGAIADDYMDVGARAMQEQLPRKFTVVNKRLSRAYPKKSPAFWAGLSN